MTGNLFDSPAPASGTEPHDWFIAHCDGGSRGNPGPAGYGVVIENLQGQTVARLSAFLGVQTNNYAEYSGLLAVLKWALEKGARRLKVISDSELMVKQMNGQYKVVSPVLRPLWEEARQLARRLDGFTMTHTLRGGNREADRLANEAMDRGMGKSRDQGTEGTGSRDERSEFRDQRTERTAQGLGNMYQTSASAPRSGRSQPPKPERQVLEGYVKNGVVHLLEGELPDGIFVKVVRES